MSSVPLSSPAKRSRETANAMAETHSHEYNRPSDWPPRGVPIDLSVQDLQHNSADTEWWYVNGHVKDSNEREYSFFASFFKIVREKKSDGSLVHAHALNWGIVDIENQKYHSDPILDYKVNSIIKRQLEDGSYDIDPRIRRAFHEMVSRDHCPLPDRCFKGPCHIDDNKLNIDYEGNTFSKDSEGNYHLHCECNIPNRTMTLSVKLKPMKKAILQGHEGIVKIGLKQDTMFYYFIPRNQCEGTISIGGGKPIAVKGLSWYDHEFGGAIKVRDGSDESIVVEDNSNGMGKRHKTEDNSMADEEKLNPINDDLTAVETQSKDAKKKKKSNYAWNWISLQLDNGTDVTATLLVDPSTGEIFDNYAITIGPDSVRHEYPDSEMVPLKTWMSIRTTCDYPTEWKLLIPSAKTDLHLVAAFDNQEFITLISKPAFWEGRVNVTGTLNGSKVTGKGFIERHGFTSLMSLDSFFKRISSQVLEQVEAVMPRDPTFKEAEVLLTSDEFKHLMDGLNIEVFRDTIITPLREIIDRGGKSWRSFAFLLCIDCVGGDSTPYKPWLAMPEMMHVGSLIVDDIQDKSEIRRGGPACHIVHGEPIAINAGTAAYFLSFHLLQERTPWLTPALKLRIYELYFLTLRAGHAGQAFDIKGLDYMMGDAVEKGASADLLKRVACTHRLKSAVPAGALARMGSAVGGGTPEQTEKLGTYMESIGLAFQIIDDVLNLRGFRDTTKTKGEDITAGKVTFPVAMAMSLMDKPGRAKLWKTLQSKPEDRDTIDRTIDDLERCGAIQGSVDHSEKIVRDAWNALDSCIPDSFFKMMLRAFGWYVLERHY